MYPPISKSGCGSRGGDYHRCVRDCRYGKRVAVRGSGESLPRWRSAGGRRSNLDTTVTIDLSLIIAAIEDLSDRVAIASADPTALQFLLQAIEGVNLLDLELEEVIAISRAHRAVRAAIDGDEELDVADWYGEPDYNRVPLYYDDPRDTYFAYGEV